MPSADPGGFAATRRAAPATRDPKINQPMETDMDGSDGPVTGKCPVMHTHATRSNSDWWPNQLNLKILHQNSAKSDPMGVDFDYRDEETWQFAEKVLPEAYAWEFNLAILDFAAAICTPKTPNCEGCFFNDQCSYYRSRQ